jgi:hypothetical protein
MNHNKFRIILLLALLPTISFPLWAANCGVDKKGVDEIITVFHTGINLNERFKISVTESDHEKYLKLRAESESYDKEKLLPCMHSATDILSKKKDPKLANAMLRVAISYVNSANEEIPDMLGEIFGKNPDAIIGPISELSLSDQKLVISLLRFGWANVKQEFSPKIIEDRQVQLHQLSK